MMKHCEEKKDMHRTLVRWVILASALVVLVVPAVNAPFPIAGLPGPSAASACSNPGCVITGTVTGAIDTYYSPITLSVTSLVIAEHPLAGQPTGALTLPGTLSLSINDRRGNNQGFVVSVSSGGFATRLSSTTIPGSAVAVNGVNATTAACLGVGSMLCSSIIPLVGAYGKTLENPVAVAAECPTANIGMGLYNVGVNLNVGLNGTTAEVFGFAPASWYGTFNVMVDESAPSVRGACGGTS